MTYKFKNNFLVAALEMCGWGENDERTYEKTNDKSHTLHKGYHKLIL